MGQKIGAGVVLAIIGVTLMVFGVGFLGYAITAALTPSLGVAGAAAVTGGIFTGPPFLWAIAALLVRRPPPKPAPIPPGSLWMTLFQAIAKETPWVAIVGAGLVAAAEIFLVRRKK
ncbi:MAG TPA: hypothetical protein VMU08_09375 [Rhizomicrobium sp.]|nr:hypothetical protein [Rhizomicrobium sp.]